MNATRKTRPAPWTTVPSEARRRKRQAARRLEELRARERNKLRKRLRPVSRRRREAKDEYRQRAANFLAAASALGELCPVAAAGNNGSLPDWQHYGRKLNAQPTEVHHVRGRAGALLLEERYWLALSAEGHRWVHDHPAEATRRGWLSGMGEWGNSTERKEMTC